MNKKWIIIGTVILMVLILIGVVVLKTNIIFKDSSIDLAAEYLNDSDALEIEIKENNDIHINFINTSELKTYLTDSEIRDLESKISELFTTVFPNIANIKGDYTNYFNQNKGEILIKTGIESEEEFISFAHKLNRIQEYETCSVVLVPESLELIKNNYLMNFDVTYDEDRVVEFYTILNLKDLQLKIK